MMKQPIDLKTAMEQTRCKTAGLRAASIVVPEKKPRVKPRKPSETLALCRAVVWAVLEAKSSGRLVKLSPVGYRLRWEE